MTIDGLHYKANTKTEKFNFRNVDTNIEAGKVSMTIDGFHYKANTKNRKIQLQQC
jgi:ribosomal protein L6P/L9E